MTPAPPLLETIDEIDVDWLRSVLISSGLKDVPPIRDIKKESIGAGTVGDTQRIKIFYESEAISSPQSVVCKFHSTDPASRESAAQSGAFIREVEAYKLLSTTRACRIPYVYLASYNQRGMNLVLQDLSEITEPGDQIAGCSISEAETVVDELAILHSRFFALIERDTAKWMMNMQTMADSWASGIRSGAELAPKRFRGNLSEDAISKINTCADVADEWYRRIPPCLTFTHGDPRVDNIMFEKSAHGTHAIVLDWQLAGVRSPMYDVAYFISSSLQVEDRQQAEKGLLQRYFSKVSDTNIFPNEQSAMNEYKINIVSNLMLSILSTIALPATPEIDKLILTLLNRTLAATDDVGGLATVKALLRES